MKIRSAALTHCGLVADGRAVGIDLVDEDGANVSVELSLEQAQAIARTLPAALAPAVRNVPDKLNARFILPLDRWTVEQSKDGTGLLLTLAAADGSEVCFAVPSEACQGLGRVLASSKGPVAENPGDRTAPPSSKPLH
jgi:hypothetical protein